MVTAPTAKKIAGQTVVITMLAVACAVFLLPVYSLTVAAFRPGRDLLRFGITWKTLIPVNLDLNHLSLLFTSNRGLYVFWFRNSIELLVLRTVVTVLISSWVGYGLAMYNFVGRKLLLSLVIFLMVIPIQILILPLYKLMIGLKLMNTLWGVILPFVAFPVAIFFFRQFASGLPRDFLDAGRIDGLTEYGIFFRIMMPLMAPAYGAMVILVALQSWNDFLWPLIVLRTEDMFTLPIGLNSLLTPYGNNYDLLLSGALAATVPIVIVFFIFQRYFITGLTAGGIKG